MATIKNLFLMLCLFAAHIATAQSLKSVLHDQLKSTHDKENWFVPVSAALEGLTAEQATGPTAAEIILLANLPTTCSSGTKGSYKNFVGKNPLPSMVTTTKHLMPLPKSSGRQQ